MDKTMATKAFCRETLRYNKWQAFKVIGQSVEGHHKVTGGYMEGDM